MRYDCDSFCGLKSALAFLSFTSSVYMAIAIYKALRLKRPTSPLVMAVFFMSFCDAFFSAFIIFEFGPMSTSITDDEFFCISLNIIAQFFETASFCWYFVICVLTLLVLRGYSYLWIQSTAPKQHMFVWGFSLTMTCLPYILKSLWEDLPNVIDCQPAPKLDLFNYFFYGPLACLMLFALTLLLYTSCKVGHFRGKVRRRMLLRMVAFVVVFVMVWFFPLVYKIYGLITAFHSSPDWLRSAHELSLAISGFANFVVWVTSRSVSVMLMEEIPDYPESPSSTNSMSGHGFDRLGSRGSVSRFYRQGNRSIAQTSQPGSLAGSRNASRNSDYQVQQPRGSQLDISDEPLLRFAVTGKGQDLEDQDVQYDQVFFQG